MYDFVVVDASLVAYANWWPVRSLITSTGQSVGLEYGFIKAILSIVRSWYPAKVVLAWDGEPVRCKNLFQKEIDSKGKEIFYKSGRQKHKDQKVEEPWGPRLEKLREVFRDVCLNLYDCQTEADEQIARFCFALGREGKRVLIYSKDRDFHQLVSNSVEVVSGKDPLQLITQQRVLEIWGVLANKIVYRRAIEGDSSDSIKGVGRIPKEVIIKIVVDSESFEGFLLNLQNPKYYKTSLQFEKIKKKLDLIQRNYYLMELESQKQFQPTIVESKLRSVALLLDFCAMLEFKSFVGRKEFLLFG